MQKFFWKMFWEKFWVKLYFFCSNTCYSLNVQDYNYLTKWIIFTYSESSSGHVYAPVASPAPPSPMPASAPMTHLSTNIASAASMEPGIVPQLQNIVSTVSLGCTLDLKKIALHARNAEYNPKRFAAVIMRIRDPRTTALIFR